MLKGDATQLLLKRIEENREKFLLEYDRRKKRDLVTNEETLRKQLESELEKLRIEWIENRQKEIKQKVNQLPNQTQRKQLRDKELKKFEVNKKIFEAEFEDARKIAHWKPYDQNAVADWFNPEWMFGVRDGFDVVIGNPPYRQVKKGFYSSNQFPFSEGKDKGKQNLYKLFVEQSFNLCKDEGIATLIVQSSLMCDQSSAATRQLLLDQTQLEHIIEFPKQAKSKEAQVFDSVTQGTCIYQFAKALPISRPINISVGNDTHTIKNLDFVPITKNIILTLYPDLRYFPHIKRGYASILERITSNDKIKPLRNYATNIVQGDLNLTTHASRFSNTPTSVLLMRGKHVARYTVKFDETNEYCDEGFMQDIVDKNQSNRILICQQVTGTVDHRRLHFALASSSSERFLWGNSVNKTLLINQSYSWSFLAILNSKFMDWYFRITSTNNHVQIYEIEQLPIPQLSGDMFIRLDSLAKQMITAKEIDPEANTSSLEDKIDKLVYKLYNLTEEEIVIVEGKE